MRLYFIFTLSFHFLYTARHALFTFGQTYMDRMINLNNQQLITRLLAAYAIVSFGAILYLIATHIQSRRALDTGLIRAKGIILLDSAGRERILIGAPIPYSDDRIRTDTTRVRELWSEQLGGASYMEWYQFYRHSCNGMVLLNDQGYDVLAVGDELPDPNTGNRITEPTGIVWNDSLGFERGGLGLGKLLSNGLYRNILGLDDENGEGFHLSILEDGTKSMRIVSDSQLLFLGYFPKGGLMGDTAQFYGTKRMLQNGSELSRIAF